MFMINVGPLATRDHEIVHFTLWLFRNHFTSFASRLALDALWASSAVLMIIKTTFQFSAPVHIPILGAPSPHTTHMFRLVGGAPCTPPRLASDPNLNKTT